MHSLAPHFFVVLRSCVFQPSSCVRSLLLTEHVANWTSRSAVEGNVENERFTVVFSRCRWNLKFGNFSLTFDRLRQRIVLKCVPHVQHDYFFSFNQSDHCFLASSLLLPSSVLKLLSETDLILLKPKREFLMRALRSDTLWATSKRSRISEVVTPNHLSDN